MGLASSAWPFTAVVSASSVAAWKVVDARTLLILLGTYNWEGPTNAEAAVAKPNVSAAVENFMVPICYAKQIDAQCRGCSENDTKDCGKRFGKSTMASRW